MNEDVPHSDCNCVQDGLVSVTPLHLDLTHYPSMADLALAFEPAKPAKTAKPAKATIAMAYATIATGLLAHWDDFHLEDGITDPDNLHVLLGVTGAALMAYAVNKSKNSSVPVSHAGIAELGALGMVAAIKITW